MPNFTWIKQPPVTGKQSVVSYRRINHLWGVTAMFQSIITFIEANGLWLVGFAFYLVVLLVASKHEDKKRRESAGYRLSKGRTSIRL